MQGKTTKLKGFPLYPHEIRQLQKAGEVCVARVCKLPESPESIESITHLPEIDAPGTWRVVSTARQKYSIRSPFGSPGTRMLYSRYLLETRSVVVKRVQDISEAEAEATGVDRQFRTSVRINGIGIDQRIPLSYRGGFANQCGSLYGRGTWASNPFVFIGTLAKATTQDHTP